MAQLYRLLPLLLLISPVSAVTATPVVHLDQTGYMPSALFMFILGIAVVTLIFSYHFNDEMCGAIAIATWFITMWTSRAIDFMSGTIALDSTTISVTHAIYHPEIITILSIVCFIIAILNEVRIYVLSGQASGA